MKDTSRAAWLTLLSIVTVSAGAHAQGQPGAIPEFIPSSPWIVGESGLGEARGLPGLQLPCMMLNQYNNGFVIRFAGGGGQLTAMAVDFRQDIFAAGTRYPAALYTDNGFRGTVQGSAFNASTLVFNLRDTGDVYNALRGARVLGLSIGQNDMRFSTSNLGQGLTNLETCYGGGGGTGAAQQQAAAPAPARVSEAPQSFPGFDEQPTSLAEIQQGAAGREVYIKRGEALPQTVSPRMSAGAAMKSTGSSPSQANMGAAVGAWNARAGESLQTVVSRWAQTAGVDLQWQASGSGGVVAQDFAHSGSFNDAVGALIAENAAASGLRSQYDSGAGPRANAPSYVAPDVPQTAASSVSAVSRAQPYTSGQWQAPRGSSLQAVLSQWAATQNVELLWYATGAYPVKQDINQGGTFETALQTILQSFEGDNNRPVARLNTDPSTGRKVLVVESDRTL